MALGLAFTFAASGAAAAPQQPLPSAVVPASVATQVSVVVPLIVPSGSGGLLDAETLADYTEPLGILTRQLDAIEGQPVSVAIDPMILASIRVLGSSAPPTAREWLQRLSVLSNPTVPLPYANADPTLVTQNGSAETLEPLSFDFALNSANFSTAEPATDAVTTPAPIDVGTDEVPPFPSTQQLLAWDFDLENFLFPRPDTVVSSDLEAFAASEYDTVVLSSNNVSRAEGAGSVLDVDGVRVLVSDADASAAMHTALGSTLDVDVVDADAALAAAVQAAGAKQSAATASVLITVDHSMEMSAARLDSALTSLITHPAITIVPLTELAAAPQSAAMIVDSPHSEDRLGDVARLIAAAAKERSFFAIAADPAALISERRLNLLDVLGSIPSDNPADWLTDVNRFLVDSRDTLSAIAVVESSDSLLLADNGFLPVSVSNGLGQAVTVYITVKPRTALLAVGDSRVELHIEPNSQAKGNVPVQSLSNGMVEVTVSLSSSTGLPIGSSEVRDINVQAGWETPIVLALAILVFLIFGVGFVRSSLRRKKPASE